MITLFDARLLFWLLTNIDELMASFFGFFTLQIMSSIYITSCSFKSLDLEEDFPFGGIKRTKSIMFHLLFCFLLANYKWAPQLNFIKTCILGQ